MKKYTTVISFKIEIAAEDQYDFDNKLDTMSLDISEYISDHENCLDVYHVEKLYCDDGEVIIDKLLN